MIFGFSPQIRRFIALAVFLLFMLISVEFIIIPAIEHISNKKNELENSRFELSRLRNIADWPNPPEGQVIEDDLILRAKDRTEALNLYRNYILSLANQRGIALNITLPDSESNIDENIITTISLTGPENSVMLLIADIENGRPLVRFHNWKIQYEESSGNFVTLNSELITSWSQI